MLHRIFPALFLVTLLLTGGADAQTVVARYDFETAVPAPSVDADAGSVAGTFQGGAGITLSASTVGDNSTVPFTTSVATGDTNAQADGASFSSGDANATTQATAITNNDYVSFTLTPQAGFEYDFTQLQFKVAQQNNNTAEGFFVRSNLTGSTDLTTGTVTTSLTGDGEFQLVTVNLSSFTALQDVTTPTEFRIYFYNPNGGSTGGTNRLDKVELQANVIPEPSTYVLLGVGLLVCAQRLRRRRG